MQKRFRLYFLPILSGFLIGTSYIPFPPWALLFCITPLWLFWWKESSLKKVFFAGWITQFILNAIGFHWIAHTTMEFGQMPWYAGLAVLLLFCTLAHLYYPVAGLVWKWMTRKLNLSPATSFLLLPLVFIFCERIYPFIFYWHFGYPWLWARFPGYQLAEWIGFFGINLITLYINAFFALFWLERKPGQWIHKRSTWALGIFIAANIAGFVLSFTIDKPDQKARVLVVQGNIGNLDKIQAQYGVGYIEKTVQTYLDLTRKALENEDRVDLVVWPETAFPEVIYPQLLGRYRKKVSQISVEYDVQILSGAYQRDRYGGQVYNGLVLMKGDRVLSSYQKTVLLAFGEYFPFSNYFPKLKKMFPMVSDFGRGPGPTVIEGQSFKIGAQICYEGLFDYFSTELQQKGAQMFINVTNDSWFGYPFEPYQHMFMTLARAVENRRPLVRVTNTGISTAILHDGTLREFSPHQEKWYKIFEIPYHSTPPSTFYVKLADKWPFVLLILMGLIIAGDRIARTGKY